MAWLIESFLNENKDIKKAIENHKQEIKKIDSAEKQRIAKVNDEADYRIDRNPDKEKRINRVRKLQIASIRKGAEVVKQKHRDAINTLEKTKEDMGGSES